MRPSRRSRRGLSALALACLAAACGGGEAASPRRVDPTPQTFSVANLDINQPCTVLTADDAADISGLPFYRTMAANLVEDGRVRCAQGVGAYGLHGVVEVDMQAVGAGGGAAQDLFARECRVMAGAEPPRAPVPVIPPEAAFQRGEARIDPAALATGPVAAPVPAINGPHCVLAGGGYAVLMPDRVVVMRVRQSAGEIDAAATRRLASLISFRLTSN